MLAVELGRLRLENPILTASGTFGFGKEYDAFVDLPSLGGVVTKTLYLQRRRGNPPPRVVEVAGGMLNSIGLENPGCDAFEAEILPWLREQGVTVIASCAGERAEDFPIVASRLDAMDGVAAIEVNLSCPNVKKGGLDLGTDPQAVRRIVSEVRSVTEKPIIAKLTPNTADIGGLARAAAQSGAEALSLINTLAAMAIDWRKREPILGARFGGLSGPCIKPVALRMVWLASQAVDLPIIGIGGIRSTEDVLEFLVAGASAVQVGTANFFQPNISQEILEELPQLLEKEGIEQVSELIGTLRKESAAVSSGACSGATAPGTMNPGSSAP